MRERLSMSMSFSRFSMAAFSFDMFLNDGRGAIIVHEEHFRQRPNGGVDARLEWINQDAMDAFSELKELASMVSEYDPNMEFVFVTLGNDNRGDPMVLQTAENGVTPWDAYEHDRESQSIEQWKAGCILRLEDVVDGIDAPERRQAYGRKAKQALSSKVYRKQVEVTYSGKDRYGRIIGEIHLGERWINKELVAEGWAWHYKKYSSDKELAAAEVQARKKNSDSGRTLPLPFHLGSLGRGRKQD